MYSYAYIRRNPSNDGTRQKKYIKLLYEAVRAKSNADVAGEVVYGCEKAAHTENNSDWVKSVMRRLENKFESEDVKEIRMNCQCGYGMNEKLVLVKELMAGAASIEEFTNSEKAKAAGLFCKGGGSVL